MRTDLVEFLKKERRAKILEERQRREKETAELDAGLSEEEKKARRKQLEDQIKKEMKQEQLASRSKSETNEPIKDGENIDRALKRYKRKFDKTGTVRQLRARQAFIKPSVVRRAEIQKAAYIQNLRDNIEG
jgi:small subunit ribosomal protein S21